MDDKIFMGNGRLFYFNDDGKLDVYYIIKNIPCEIIYASYYHWMHRIELEKNIC